MADQVAQAVDLLKAGDPKAALGVLQSHSAVLPDEQKPWLAFAQVHNRLGDTKSEMAALQALLVHDPRNLVGLLLAGNRTAHDGDDRAATAYYQAALNQASVTTNIPQSLTPLLMQADTFLGGVGARFEAHLHDHLAKAGFAEASKSGRIGQSVDLLLGRSQLYVQQPTSFYFPGLPQRQFYERAEFDWVAEIEAATPAMQAELAGLMEAGDGFNPYVETVQGRPQANNPLRDDPSWSALYFWRGGALQDENAKRAPATVRALKAAPIPVIAGRSPMVLYSRLEPGTHIQPHHGLLNTRLICHLPLITPADCALRVGSETRSWEAGKMLIFDDSIEHEAWNRSSETRVVLLFEIWRPEITPDERAALTALYEAISDYKGVPIDEG